MASISTVFINAVLLGSLYALIAVGFTLIFGVGGVINLGHGANITIGAFSAILATKFLGFGVGVGILAAMLAPAMFSAIIYQGIIRYIQDEPIIVMILTLVVALIVEEFIFVTHGTAPLAVPILLTNKFELAGFTIQGNRLFAFVLSWTVIVALFLLVNRTFVGKAILATSMSRQGASLVGIEEGRINLYTWTLAGLLAGLAGYFLGSFQTASFDMGLDPLLLSFAIVVLGGIGSIRGSVIGAYVIGTVETITTSVISPRMTGVASLTLLILVLIIKPEGLFGRELAE